MEKERYIGLFSDLADMERRYAEELKVLAERVRHPVLRVLLLGIASDSEKHALIYQAVLELITRYQPALSQEDFKALAEGIAKHVETEAKMMEITRDLLGRFGDPRVKLLVAAIHDDEVKHHKVLISIRDNIASEYVVKEEDVWEIVWRESPWHGAPGG